MSTEIKTINGINYALDSSNGTAAVVRQDKLNKSKIVIPSYVKSLFKKYKVTRVDDEAFKGLAIKQLIIGRDIEYIGNFAFYWCRELTSVVIDSGGKHIGKFAFSDCDKLESLEIRSGVTDIGDYAFFYCTKLTSVELPDTLSELSVDVFCGCHSLPRILVPASVKRIGAYACKGCYNLTEINLLEGLESIEKGAFEECDNLSELNIPDSVTSIGNDAFGIWFNNSSENYVDKWAVQFYNRCRSITLRSDTVGIADYAFAELKSDDKYSNDSHGYRRLSAINIPNGVKYIGACAFMKCKDLTEIVLPESVVTIGNEAFSGCVNLIGSINIPDGVKRIGAGAFMDCTGITEIRIPESVTEIGENAFGGCTALTINCEAESKPSGWNEDWNNSGRPVNWTVNDDGAIDKVRR